MNCQVKAKMINLEHVNQKMPDGKVLDFWRGTFTDSDAFMDSDRYFSFTLHKDLVTKLDPKDPGANWVGKEVLATGILSQNRGSKKFTAIEITAK